MATIFGHIGLADTDRVFSSTIGQRVIYEAATMHVAKASAELDLALVVFLERSTDEFKLRYKLPGGGYLQRRAEDGRYGAIRPYGGWDVGLPLEDLGAMLTYNDVARAYMSAAELDRHIQEVENANINTVRFEVLKRLFNNVQTTFEDPLHGSILVEPLANGDAVTYPPELGAAADATEDLYLESGYAASAISDTNDPYVTIVNKFVDHFGETTGGENIITFINYAQAAKTEALTSFVEVQDGFVRTGVNTDVPDRLPTVPGRIIGRHTAGTWVSVWRRIPANYMLAIHLEEEAPLLRRIDPADTGLGDGLQLVAMNEQFPFIDSVWRHRFGVGAGNRLNGVVMELGVGGTYSIPSEFA